MSQPTVEVRTVWINEDEDSEGVEIYLNGALVAEGRFGGEPEDNSRYRDYGWVDDAISGIAKKLGAKVEFTEILES